MAPRNPDEKSTRHHAVRLDQLIGQESAPLPSRKAPTEGKEAEMNEEIIHESGKTPQKRGKTRENDKKKPRPAAYDAAMTILACGDNSEKMLREKLTRKGYTPSEIGGALDVLREKRYICDQRLMERYASSLARKKYYGGYRIRLEVQRRFDREVVEEYFEDAIREIDFFAQARAFVEKNCSHMDREKLILRLRALTYTPAQIRAALSLTDLDSDNPDD